MRTSTALVIIGLSLFCFGASADETLKQAIDHAQALRVAGHPAEAEAALLQILAKWPNDYRATYVLGLAYSDEKKSDLAIATFRKASELREQTGSKDYTIYNTLGWEYLQRGDTANAKAQFQKGVDAKDFLSKASYARVANNLALVHMSEGNPSKSRPLLQDAAAAGSKLAKFNLSILDSTPGQLEFSPPK